jgi:CelD/BcsL family acetyltransferase involved in cellulose biosynthesis
VHGTIDTGYRVEWRPLAELASLADEWRALAARALEPNVFYEPAFALAAAPVFGRDAGAGLVWSRGNPARLLALFPARIERRRYGVTCAILVGWTHPYGPLGSPLVDRDAAEAVIAAWLNHVASTPDLPKFLLMPYLPAEGPLAQAFDAALRRTGGKRSAFGGHRRALLAPSGDRGGYLDHAIAHKKRKELRRQRKRLADTGAITSDGVGDPQAVKAALDDFLALEAGGWKGRAGTAAQADTATRDFLQSAVTALAAEGKARIDRLCVGGRPIAASVTLVSGGTAWCWKTAYDESAARYSPGAQVLLDLTQRLLDDPGIVRADSCATADHPMIDHVWRERLPLCDRLVHVGSGNTMGFALVQALETLRRVAIARLRPLRGLRRR